jgi:hypothetical protein
MMVLQWDPWTAEPHHGTWWHGDRQVEIVAIGYEDVGHARLPRVWKLKCLDNGQVLEIPYIEHDPNSGIAYKPPEAK